MRPARTWLKETCITILNRRDHMLTTAVSIGDSEFDDITRHDRSFESKLLAIG